MSFIYKFVLRLISVTAALIFNPSLAENSLNLQMSGKLFDLNVNVGGSYNPTTDTISGGNQTTSLGFTTVSQLFDQTQESGIRQANSVYTPSSAAVVRLGYRGVPLVLQTEAGSSAVKLFIPLLGVEKTFDLNSTRDANMTDVRNYLKNSGGDTLNKLQQQLARYSPVDPIAGNPASMQHRMASDDFDRNFLTPLTNSKSSQSSENKSNTKSSNEIGIGLAYGSTRSNLATTQLVTIPLSYTVRSDLDPRKQFNIYAPVTFMDTAGGKTVGVNVGVSYSYPVSDEWTITPSGNYGVTGSSDLGSAAAMLGASLMSQYTIRKEGFDVAIGNMVGQYQSAKFSLGGYSIDPQIKNTIFRNGILFSVPTTLAGHRLSAEYSYINTLYTGTALYSKKYNEVGATLGTNRNANSSRSFLRAGVSYLQGEYGLTGLKLNLGYWF